MEENNKKPHAPIDLSQIVRKIWDARKLFSIILPSVLIGTYLITLCVPRYYTCTVELAPESSSGGATGSLGSLAASFGLDGLSKLGGGNDAINALLYPDLLKSPDFIITLCPVKVTTKDGQSYTYYEYMEKHQKAAVWDKYIFGPLYELMNSDSPLSGGKQDDKIDLRRLTKKQSETIDGIVGKLKCVIDKKTDAITITVEDQDPVVCTTIGDSVLSRIQQFIVDYRTKKARNDYAYYDKLIKEAEKKYLTKKAQYASYADSHHEAILESVNAEEENLRDNMSNAYDIYSTMSKMREQALAKIQENTPAFTVLKSPTLPQKPAGPKRTKIALLMTIVAFCVLTTYVWFKKEEQKQ